MLERPISIRLAAFEMADCEREFSFLDRLFSAPATDPHNASGRSANILPISVGHGILVSPSQMRLGQARQFGQRLGIDFHRYHSTRLHGGGIKGQCILNLYAFGEQIGFLLSLHDHFPVLSYRG